MRFRPWSPIAFLLITVAAQATAADSDVLWAQTVVEAGVQAVRQHLGDSYDSVDIKAVTADVHNPCGRQAPVLRQSLVVTATLSPRMAASAEVACPGGRVKSVVTWYSVSATAPVLVAARDLAVGEALNAHDLQTRPQDVARLRGSPLQAGTIMPGAYRIKAPIQKGQAMLASYVEPTPAIEAGRTVQATYRSGEMVLHFSGVAMRDASLGGVVPIQRPGATDTLSARVSAPGEVELLP